MRPFLLIATASVAVASAGAAYAGSVGPVSQISISFDQKLLEDSEHIIGAPEQERLETQLRRSIEEAIGGLDSNGGRLELVIEDAKPNRPTFTQLRHNTSLSYGHSFGVGGAKIKGVYVAQDGSRTAVNYRWYSSDIRDSRYVSDWYDVDRSFRYFAHELADG